MKLAITLFALALPAAASASIAPDAVLALRVVALARAAGIVADADARAVYRWISEPGRFPDTAAVSRFLDPRLPAPEGAAAPPPLTLRRDAHAATLFVRGLPVDHLGPFCSPLSDVFVRFTRSGSARFDRVARCIYIPRGADLATLLHEAGHAVRYTPELADYQRVFRDFPGAASPEETALWQNEMLADAAFAAGVLSAARASRSYWIGIAAVISSDFTPAGVMRLVWADTTKQPQGNCDGSQAMAHGQPGVPVARRRRSE